MYRKTITLQPDKPNLPLDPIWPGVNGSALLVLDGVPASELAGALSGAEIVLSEFWDAPGAMSFSPGARLVDVFHPSVGDGSRFARALKSLRLTKLVDVAKPKGYPIRVSLDFSGFAGFSGWDAEAGTTMDQTWRGENASFWDGCGYYTAPVMNFSSDTDEAKSLSRDVKVYPSFVVVVDWNFSHLAETPYEPDPYTPEWLSTDSP